jgi:uncharacterized membrane protein (TIGR02234 family)
VSHVPPPRAQQQAAESAASAAPEAVEPDPAAAGQATAGQAAAAATVVARGSGRPRSATRALAAALALGVIGASLVLLAAGKTWSHGTASFGGAALPVHADGSQTTALPGALALVGLASLVAVFAVRRAARTVVSALLALSGLGTVATALARRGDRHALDEAAARATGLSRAAAEHVTVTAWPLVAAAGGVLLLAAGLLALGFGRHWPAMSGTGRYERGGRPAPAVRRAAPPVDPDRPEDLWKALDRGEDPTG